MANKTWNKSKTVMAVSWCGVCQKELLSDAGGWIVNAEKKHFCPTVQALNANNNASIKYKFFMLIS